MHKCSYCPKLLKSHHGKLQHERSRHGEHFGIRKKADGTSVFVCECEREFATHASRRVHRTHCVKWKEIHRAETVTQEDAEPDNAGDCSETVDKPPEETLYHLVMECDAVGDIRELYANMYIDAAENTTGDNLWPTLVVDLRLVYYVYACVCHLGDEKELPQDLQQALDNK
jgi:hypothetical protein